MGASFHIMNPAYARFESCPVHDQSSTSFVSFMVFCVCFPYITDQSVFKNSPSLRAMIACPSSLGCRPSVILSPRILITAPLSSITKSFPGAYISTQRSISVPFSTLQRFESSWQKSLRHNTPEAENDFSNTFRSQHGCARQRPRPWAYPLQSRQPSACVRNQAPGLH